VFFGCIDRSIPAGTAVSRKLSRSYRLGFAWPRCGHPRRGPTRSGTIRLHDPCAFPGRTRISSRLRSTQQKPVGLKTQYTDNRPLTLYSGHYSGSNHFF